MPTIGEYESNAHTHTLYTQVSQHFFNTDFIYNKYVVHAAREVAIEMEQRLQKADAALCDSCWQQHPSVMAVCLRGR